MTLACEVLATDGAARAAVIRTAHGEVETPVFMPVGTAGTVKAMTADAVRSTGARIVLGNTYHLMLRPGADRVEALGGLHRFMDWPGPILTDSGGFQIMSLSKLRRMDADGVTFQSHVDGSAHRLTPAISMDVQRKLDATITMALDECTPFPATEAQASASLDLSMRWALLSKQAFVPRAGYGLFGILQGGVHPHLRARSAAALTAIGFDGYAVGGLAVGEGQAMMFETLDVSVPLLPADRPRYLMGVGTPDDILGAVQRGIDMFDCVMPTRSGRMARAFTRGGMLNLRNARHAADPAPLDPLCACPACAKHSRAYLHHLFRADEMLGPMLLTWHNLVYYADLTAGLRIAIREAGSPGTPPRSAPSGGKMTSKLDGLTQLGRPTAIPADPDAATLERVPSPAPDRRYCVRFTAPEFTSLCPLTGQPDFAHLVVDYVPGAWIVESKSLKLYLQSFRNHGAFHEDCTMRIAAGLAALLDPVWLRIGAYWYPRGGIPIDVFWQTGAPPDGVWIPGQDVASYRGRG